MSADGLSFVNEVVSSNDVAIRNLERCGAIAVVGPGQQTFGARRAEGQEQS